MSHKTQLTLAKTSIGRIVLHLRGIARDHKLMWHMKGISRELKA